MKLKNIIFVIFLLAILGIAIGLKLYFKPHADISKIDAAYKMEALTLANQFKADENAATSKYAQKPIEITGNLVTKSKLPNGADLLVLEDKMQGVSCELDRAWSDANLSVIESLQAGKSLTVKGICKGYLMEVKVSPAIVVVKQ